MELQRPPGLKNDLDAGRLRLLGPRVAEQGEVGELLVEVDARSTLLQPAVDREVARDVGEAAVADAAVDRAPAAALAGDEVLPAMIAGDGEPLSVSPLPSVTVPAAAMRPLIVVPAGTVTSPWEKMPKPSAAPSASHAAARATGRRG